MLTDGIFPFVTGGMQKHSYYLARFLSQQKVRLTLAHCVFHNDEIPQHHPNGFENIELDVFKFPRMCRFPGHYIFESLQYSRNLFRHYQHRLSDFDIIYAQGFTSLAFTPNSGVKLPPVIVNLHGLEMFQLSGYGKPTLSQLMLRVPAEKVMQNADIVQSLGGKLTEILQQRCPPHKIQEMGIGIEQKWLIDFSNIKPTGEVRQLLFVGRDEFRKGLHLLNPVLTLLLQNGYLFEAHFIGPIPERNRVKSPHFHYHGIMKDENKIRQIMDSSDILMVPSISEGMPTVILEAMSRGLAILATDVGAVSTMVSEHNGILVPPFIEDVLKEAIRYVLDTDSSKLQRMKEYSRRHAENFTWEKIIGLHMELFAKAKALSVPA
jgi:glycosyltransferase involved in cell wall biosynthesis